MIIKDSAFSLIAQLFWVHLYWYNGKTKTKQKYHTVETLPK
jgi:hypothetical protein